MYNLVSFMPSPSGGLGHYSTSMVRDPGKVANLDKNQKKGEIKWILGDAGAALEWEIAIQGKSVRISSGKASIPEESSGYIDCPGLWGSGDVLTRPGGKSKTVDGKTVQASSDV